MATDRKDRKSSKSSGRSSAHSATAKRSARGRGRAPDDAEEVIDAEIGGEASGRSERPKAIPDLFRRAMAMGLSGFFTTEEAFRRALGDTVPQDWVDFVGEQSERTRAELIERMSNELSRVIQQVDIAELLAALLKGQTVEVDARIRLVPDDPRKKGASSSDRIRVRLSTDPDQDDQG